MISWFTHKHRGAINDGGEPSIEEAATMVPRVQPLTVLDLVEDERQRETAREDAVERLGVGVKIGAVVAADDAAARSSATAAVQTPSAAAITPPSRVVAAEPCLSQKVELEGVTGNS